MLVTLTHSEMLRLWRAAAGLEPMRADCTVERVEGIDANAMIEPRMRTWYLRLLDTADPALLPTADVRDEIVLSPCREHAAATAVLPERARRLLELRLTGWLNPARPCLPPEERLRGLLARNPYCARSRASRVQCGRPSAACGSFRSRRHCGCGHCGGRRGAGQLYARRIPLK